MSDTRQFVNISISRKEGLQRREFMEILGASFAGLSVTGCGLRPPKEKIIPYMNQPEEVVPGVANWYASTCGGCSATCGILAKSLDGRPIKIEGNSEHPMSQGGVCARGQATVLDLYDSERLKAPETAGASADWKTIDQAILAKLKNIQESGGKIRILGRSLTSPSLWQAIKDFIAAYNNATHVVYDPISSSAILDAHQQTHRQRVLPWYRFDKARVIVSFDADFLGTWISPVEFTRAWSVNRKLGKDRTSMSWHAQFEARMSITGANADLRRPLAPSKQLAAILELGRMLARKLGFEAGQQLLAHAEPSGIDPAILEQAADELARNVGRSLIVSGSNDLQVQLVVNFLNHFLNNYGTTLDLSQPSLQRQGDDAAMDGLIDEMLKGEVAALIILCGNPAYDHPRSADFREGMKKVGLTVSLAEHKDETASLAGYVCPDHHFLESWGDAEPHLGLFSLYQPLLAPLYNTRSALESLLQWAGKPETAYNYLKVQWRQQVFPFQKKYQDFVAFWDHAVHDGVVLADKSPVAPPEFNVNAIPKFPPAREDGSNGKFQIVVYPSVPIYDGSQANNPWLQELPDPVTKVTWGNYVSISPVAARAMNVLDGQVLELSDGKHTIQLPAQVQPGMPDKVAAVALGYGRTNAGKIAANYPMEKMFPLEKQLLGGADVFPFLGASFVTLTRTGRMSQLAKTQHYDSQTIPFTHRKRSVLKETELSELGKEHPEGHAEDVGLWPEHDYKGYKWGLAIDLNACTGCSACVIACQAENNIPVVGKAEVIKDREMHWMRLDRYYTGTADAPDESPEVGIMPMLCQHCDHAPCETVCPVLATLHSSEGLNMQAYNRCVGTRYCANNCPYKVRRFNWFDYARLDPVQNLVLNPNVTVRTRGVIEKCSLCVQRISEGKTLAKRENRKVKDGDIQPACQQSCPASAIVFGDLNDPHSKVSKLSKDSRAYAVLEEVGTKPAITYLEKVRNRKES